MENRSHALAAGAFVVFLSALLLGMVFWLLRDNTEQRVFEISSPRSVAGLQVQAGVRFKGVPVGRVTQIGLDPVAHGNVLIRIAVNDQVPVTAGTVASLGFQGVTGLAFVQLDDDGGASMVALKSDSDQPARIPLQPGWMSRLTDQGERLVGQLNEVGGRVNGLLAEENQKTLMQAIANLGQAAASLQQLTQHVDRAVTGQGGAGALNLPRLAGQAEASLQTLQATADKLGTSADMVRNSAAEFRKVSSRMTEPGGTLDRVARGAEALNAGGQAVSGTLVPRLTHIADDTARTVRQLGHVADTLAETPQALIFGKGAAAPGPGESGFVPPPAE